MRTTAFVFSREIFRTLEATISESESFACVVADDALGTTVHIRMIARVIPDISPERDRLELEAKRRFMGRLAALQEEGRREAHGRGRGDGRIHTQGDGLHFLNGNRIAGV